MMEQSEVKRPVNSESALGTVYVYGYGASKTPFYKQAKSLKGHSAGCSLILTGPVSPKATVLRSDIWCSPCYNAQGPADCRFYTTQCMKNITPLEVCNVVHRKLQERSQVSVSQEKQE